VPIESFRDFLARADELEGRVAAVGRAISEILARPASADQQIPLMALEGKRQEELVVYAATLRAYAGIPIESLADGRARLLRLEKEALAVGRTEAAVRALPVTPDQQDRVVNLERKRETAITMYAGVVRAYAVPIEPLGRYDDMSLVVPPVPAGRPIWPNRLANTLIAGAVGVMIAFALAVLFERRRRWSSPMIEPADAGPSVVGQLARERGRR
jgi:uncharacterized protein involved in exopolysaccharide biosynthesis